MRYVAVDGPVSRIEPGTDDQLVEMTKLSAAGQGRRLPRVRPPEQGESVAIWLKPQHWLSADLGSI